MQKFYSLIAIFVLFPVLLYAQQYTRKTNLPCIYINTLDGTSITSKEIYKYAKLVYVDEQDNIISYDSIQIRGRGNSTWTLKKKPYRIKFAEKELFLGPGHANAKSWTLLANAGDKTLIRNAVTSIMGEFAGLPFNPSYKFVDLCLNNTYLGNYQVSDQVEVRKMRVDVIKQNYPLTENSNITGGYLLEVDGFADGNCFTSSKYQVPIRIHYPDEDEIVARQNTYIRNYINDFETTLSGSNFTDPKKGYRPLVDSTTLVNWFICTEITGNIDGYYSTYFYKEQNDPKLYFGPLWDYDIAYDNDYRISGTANMLMTDNGYGKTKEWINRMWQDPWFTQLVNRRYQELMDNGLVSHLESAMDSLAALLDESQQLNYKKWGINTQMYHEVVLYNSYDDYLEQMRQYIHNHTTFLSTAFQNKYLEYPKPLPIFMPEDCYYHLYNAGSKKAIDVDDSGYVVQNSDSETSHTQQWEVQQVEDYFVLINRATGMALNDPTVGNVGPTVNVGTQLNTAEVNLEDERQHWTFTPQGYDGLYNLVNRYSQHVANLSGGSYNDGTRILSYTNDNRNAVSKNRQWQPEAGEALPGETDGINEYAAPDAYILAYNTETRQLRFGADNPAQLSFPVGIFNMSGQCVATFRANETHSMASYPVGTYIITWKVNGRTVSRKLKI